MSNEAMRITLKIWRQSGPNTQGAFETYTVEGVSPDMSFLEMIDVLNDRLTIENKEPVAFDMTAVKVFVGPVR